MTHNPHRLRSFALAAATFLVLATSAGAVPASPEQMNLAPGAVPSDVTGRFDERPDVVEAQATLFDFPSDGSTIVGSTGFLDSEQAGYFWSVSRGDSVTESFTGPAVVWAYALHVDVIENVLNSGAFVNWNVIINGVTVDNFTVAEGFVGTVNRTASFASIPGPGYTVELRVTNEVAGGQGSHTLRYAGVGNHQVELIGQGFTQEIPALSPLGLTCLALLLFAFGFWLLRRRRAI